jgi:CspA family cold shock protein
VSVGNGHDPEQRFSGTVKWFNVTSGYGFIDKPSEWPGEKDIFLHINSLPEHVKEVHEGQRVTFQIENVRKGARAINVKLG